MEESIYKNAQQNKLNKRNFQSERKKFNSSQGNYNVAFPSKEKILNIKKNSTLEDEDEDENNDKGHDTIEIKKKSNNNKSVTIEEKKGFFGKSIDLVSYIFHEIPLLWKKEELVKGYDANGNIVYRPKKKIPVKEKNNVDIEKINIENEANSAGVDYSTRGINYGVYFN